MVLACGDHHVHGRVKTVANLWGGVVPHRGGKLEHAACWENTIPLLDVDVSEAHEDVWSRGTRPRPRVDATVTADRLDAPVTGLLVHVSRDGKLVLDSATTVRPWGRWSWCRRTASCRCGRVTGCVTGRLSGEPASRLTRHSSTESASWPSGSPDGFGRWAPLG